MDGALDSLDQFAATPILPPLYPRYRCHQSIFHLVLSDAGVYIFLFITS